MPWSSSICDHYGPETAARAGAAAAIDLSANENPWGPSPAAVRAIIGAAGQANRYPDSHGDILKRALARQLGVDAEQIVLGNGSCEILELTAGALLDNQSEAIIGWPSFPAYRQAVRRMGGKLISVPLTNYRYDLDAITERVTTATRLIMLGNPNNPTGQAIGRTALSRFLERLPQHVTVCLDEAYRDYAVAADFPDGLQQLGAGRNVVVVRTFSKAYGLAGARLGYAIASQPLAKRLESLRQKFNTNALAQAAALAALGDREHVARSVALNAEGRTALCSRLADMGLFVLTSEANFVMVKAGNGADIAAKLEEQGVRVKSLETMELPDFIRVSIGTPAQNAQFVRALGSVLSSSGEAVLAAGTCAG